MKKILISILTLSLCLTAFSQEKNSKQGERGPFKTNEKAFDNTFIGAAGGLNFNFGDYDNGRIATALDIYFGKWWTPQVGARIGYYGIQLQGKDAYSENEKWNMNYFHADLMWNICNAIQGYRSDRVWNVMPFIGFGAANANLKSSSKSSSGVWYMAGSVGLYNTFTVAKRVDITLEGRYSMTRNEFDSDISQASHKFDSFASLTAGIAIKLGKVGFEKDVAPDYSSYENTIAEYKDALEKANTALAAAASEIKDLEDKLAAGKDEEARLRTSAGASCNAGTLELFFKKNSAVLDSKELDILDSYIKNAGKDVKFIVTGTADKATGSTAHNKKLSEQRAEYVAALLSEKYGITSVTTEGAGEVETHKNPVMNRTATIVLK